MGSTCIPCNLEIIDNYAHFGLRVSRRIENMRVYIISYLFTEKISIVFEGEAHIAYSRNNEFVSLFVDAVNTISKSKDKKDLIKRIAYLNMI
jgi:hypothetical protein